MLVQDIGKEVPGIEGNLGERTGRLDTYELRYFMSVVCERLLKVCGTILRIHNNTCSYDVSFLYWSQEEASTLEGSSCNVETFCWNFIMLCSPVL